MEWLNYHHLLYFWMVAHEGTITSAANKLHVTPATLSIQIRELEKNLGVRLFRKDGRSLKLTEMGTATLQYADEIFRSGEELMEMIHGRPTGAPVLFRVGVKDVMPKLVAYRYMEPALNMSQPMRLVCHEGGIDGLVADLSIHKLDVVLSDAPLSPSIKVRAYSHLLGESTVEFMGVPELAKRFRRKFPESLDQAPVVFPTEDTILRRALDHWFRERSMRPSIRAEFEDSAMLKIAGQSGAGLLPVPSMIAEKVRVMYGLESVGKIDGVVERFYAISIERKLSHPAVVAMCKTQTK